MKEKPKAFGSVHHLLFLLSWFLTFYFLGIILYSCGEPPLYANVLSILFLILTVGGIYLHMKKIWPDTPKIAFTLTLVLGTLGAFLYEIYSLISGTRHKHSPPFIQIGLIRDLALLTIIIFAFGSTDLICKSDNYFAMIEDAKNQAALILCTQQVRDQCTANSSLFLTNFSSLKLTNGLNGSCSDVLRGFYSCRSGKYLNEPPTGTQATSVTQNSISIPDF